MLNTRPSSCKSEEALKIWDRQRRMTFKLFQKFITTIDKTCYLYNMPDTYYSKWKVGDTIWTGMRSRLT